MQKGQTGVQPRQTAQGQHLSKNDGVDKREMSSV